MLVDDLDDPIRLSALGALAGLIQYRVDVYEDGIVVEAVLAGGAALGQLQREVQAAVAAVWIGERASPLPVRVRAVPVLTREASAKLKVVRRHARSCPTDATRDERP